VDRRLLEVAGMLFDNALVRREGVRFLNHRLVVPMYVLLFSLFINFNSAPAKSISVLSRHDDAGGEEMVAVVEETKKRG